jgi:hypothetical protein
MKLSLKRPRLEGRRLEADRGRTGELFSCQVEQRRARIDAGDLKALGEKAFRSLA